MLGSSGDFSTGPGDNNFVFLPKGRQVCDDLHHPGVTAASEARLIHEQAWMPWTDLEAQQLVSAAQLTLRPDMRGR
jgi:hypothetical protein